MAFGPHLLLATLEGLVTSAVLALMALGLSLVFGVMRVVNVAHGEFFMLGAVLAWAVASAFGGHPAVGFVAALIVSPLIVGVIALVADRLVLKRLNYNPEATIVATIGLLYIIQQAALSLYGPEARPVEAPFNYRILLPWFGYSGYKLFVIAASILLLLATWFVLSRTRIGMVMRATQYDSETAQAFGIPVGRVYAGVFAAGAMLAAIAAVLIVPISQAHYLMGRDPLLLSFIVVIIGGLGSLRGTVVAALLIGVSDGIISVFFSPTLAKIVATLAVAMVLVFRPQGLFGNGSQMSENPGKAVLLHAAVISALFALNFVLPEYHHGVMARVLVLAVFATGYNLLFGYAGLLSLGHAMFFAAGLYGAELTMYHLSWGVPAAFLTGLVAGALLALIIGVLALRTKGVAFMIVTMMFAQVAYLLVYYFGAWTRGDEGLVIQQQARTITLGASTLDLTNPTVRYMAALALFAIVLLITLALVRSSFGRVLVAIRENEERTKMLGYDTFANKLVAMVASGAICAAAGAAYVILFGYVGSTLASVQYSILPLLWVLLGGAATTLGPLVGTLFMYYVVDVTSGYTSAYMLIVGVVLILLVLYFPKGLLGTVRERWARWLP